MTASTYVISAEEKALLDAAKRVAVVWGQKDGRLHTANNGRADQVRTGCGKWPVRL